MKIDLEKIKSQKSTKELLEFSIINLDKPTGPPSFLISQYIKHTLNLKKTSHLGTLDPAVSGVLPVALNRACRLNEYLMHRNKVYVGIIRLHEEISDHKIKDTMNSFVGKVTQLPPVRSSVKRAVREREVKQFLYLERDGTDVLFQAEVEAGTYIRRLCEDVGKRLGIGAHMLELRRTKAAIFEEKDTVNLYDFDKAVGSHNHGDVNLLRKMLIPGEIIATVLPVVQIIPEFVKTLLSGSPLFERFINGKPTEKLKEGEKISAFSNDKFIGCYRTVINQDIFAVPEFVFN